MAFNLKKLLEGAVAQANVFDGGKTFATVQRAQTPVQKPKVVASTPKPSTASRIFNQVNPFDGGKTYEQPLSRGEIYTRDQRIENLRDRALQTQRNLRDAGQISNQELNTKTKSLLQSGSANLATDYRKAQGFGENAVGALLNIGNFNPVRALGQVGQFAGTLLDETPLEGAGNFISDRAAGMAGFGDTTGGFASPQNLSTALAQDAAALTSQAGLYANMAVNPALSVVATGGIAADIANETYANLKKQGIDPTSAKGQAIANGLIQAAIERVSNVSQVGRLFKGGNAATAATKSKLASGASTIFKNMASETAEEVSQGVVDNLFNRREVTTGLVESARQAALTSSVFGLGGVAAGNLGIDNSGDLKSQQENVMGRTNQSNKSTKQISSNKLQARELDQAIKLQEDVIRTAPNETAAKRARKTIGSLIKERANLLSDQSGSVPASVLNPLRLGNSETAISSSQQLQKYPTFESFKASPEYKSLKADNYSDLQMASLYTLAQRQPLGSTGATGTRSNASQQLQAEQTGSQDVSGLQSGLNTQSDPQALQQARERMQNAIRLQQRPGIRLRDRLTAPFREETGSLNPQRDSAPQVGKTNAKGVSETSESSDLSSLQASPAQAQTQQTRRTQQTAAIQPSAKVDKVSPSTKNTPNEIKIKERFSKRNVPVMKMTQDKDVVTGTNVNPNIKKGEKRYSVDEAGELIEDRKGAYRLFTNDSGEVTGFRVGKEYFKASDLGDLSDTNGYGSVLATIRRNINRSFGEKTAAKVNEFIVDHQQEQATKLIKRQVEINEGLKQVADSLGINFQGRRGKAKKVSAAIQDYGEKRITQADLVQKFGQEQATKIVEADKWFRKQYDSLLDEMNTTLEEYGYKPVPRREDYYTHFQEPGLWQSFGLGMKELQNMMSPTMQDSTPGAGRGKIDNKLAGESEYLQPNKRFNPFALRREGDARTADAFKAFERYLSPTLNNIYMTPSIARARVLSKALAQDANTANRDANKTVIQIKEWANSLAGKSNRIGDRFLADTMYGSKVLRGLQFLQRRAGANTIVGNLGSAVVQPIMLTQAVGKFGFKNVGLGIAQEISVNHKADAPIRKSKFLERRYANTRPVTMSRTQKGAQIANIPMEVIEQTATRIAWSGAYNNAISKGLKGDAAIKFADTETENTVAGRSIGERPEAFTSKSMGLATMYQLEVSNYWQQFTREMNTTQKARTLAAAYLFNIGMQALTGRSIGFNPIDAIIDSLGIAAGDDDDETTGDKAKKISQRIGGEFIDNMPFVAPAASFGIGDRNLRGLLGEQSNTGRFGVSSPVSTLFNNPWMLASPFGGSQIKKTVEGVRAVNDGALTTKSGKVRTKIDQNVRNYLQGATFGKNSIPEVKAYYNGEDKPNAVLAGGGLEQFIAEKKADRLKATDYMPADLKDIADMSQTVRQEALEKGVLSQQQFDLINNINKVDDVMAGKTKAQLSKSVADSSIGGAASKLVSSYARLSEKGVANFDSKESPEAKSIVSELNSLRPSNLPEFKATNKRAKEFVDFLGSLEDNKDEFDIQSKTRNFIHDQVLADTSEGVQKLFSAEINQIRSAAQDGKLDSEALQQAIAIDNMLLEAGLRQTPKFSNKLRGELGLASYGGSGSSSGSRTSKKKSTFDLTKLFAFDSSPVKTSGQLQAILNKALS